ncbi:hypothetical protein CKO27_02270 [Thiocystis violacea]|nr:hypothetical protein [Thiocystis violacea]
MKDGGEYPGASGILTDSRTCFKARRLSVRFRRVAPSVTEAPATTTKLLIGNRLYSALLAGDERSVEKWGRTSQGDMNP